MPSINDISFKKKQNLSLPSRQNMNILSPRKKSKPQRHHDATSSSSITPPDNMTTSFLLTKGSPTTSLSHENSTTSSQENRTKKKKKKKEEAEKNRKSDIGTNLDDLIIVIEEMDKSIIELSSNIKALTTLTQKNHTHINDIKTTTEAFIRDDTLCCSCILI